MCAKKFITDDNEIIDIDPASEYERDETDG